MRTQLSPSEPYHVPSSYGHPPTSNGNRPPQHSTSTPPGVDEMNPYSQYPGNYAPSQQPAPPPPPHPHPHPHPQRAYMSSPLPPMVHSMAPPSMGMPTHSSYMTAPQASMPQGPPSQSLTPSGVRPSAGNPPQQERKMSSSSVRGTLRYALNVVQQPQRARMCGFGDKDRRPITPPPCVRLIITDVENGREVEMNEIQSDPSFFVLQVDLWAEHADREANVVRASSNSPAVSISSATTTSYPPPAEHPRMATEGQMVYMNHDGQPMYAAVPAYAVPLARPVHPSQYGQPMYYPQVPAQNMQQFMPQTQSNSAMYTRNLIGSLTVNASQLKDNEGKVGYWFVLQDLSVRTEGFFRLRMSFIDISNQTAPGVNRGKAPVLSWIFSDVFQVYSAKKFPGVIESTPLSKTFASQGIKIPIRKDNKSEQQDDDDGE